MAEDDDNGIEVDNLKYEITGANTVSVRGFAYNESVSDLAIPETIIIDEKKYTVSAISGSAFKENYAIKKLAIPKTVKEIGYRAFFNTQNLIEINFSEGLEYIGEDAFAACYFLKEVSLPNSLQKIDYNAFNGDLSLEKITPPNNLQWIDAYTFGDTKWITNQPDGLIYFGNALLAYKGTLDETVNIKEGITLIAEEALRDNKNTKQVYFPNGVKRIAGKVFKGCSNLEYVYVPDGIEYIDNDAFYPNKKVIVSLPNVIGTYVLSCNKGINYQIRRAGQNINISNTINPYINTTDDLYIPGGATLYYQNEGFTNTKELYSYSISTSEKWAQVTISPNYDFVKIKDVNFLGYETTYDGNDTWKCYYGPSQTRAWDASFFETEVTYSIDDIIVKTTYSSNHNGDISTDIKKTEKLENINDNNQHYNILGLKITQKDKGIHIIKDKNGYSKKVIIR